MTKPPALRGKMKYSAIADLSESSQDDIPRKTTSLSMSSLLRADANFPLQFFASLPTTAAGHVKADFVWLRRNNANEASCVVRSPSGARRHE
jgi:hypothetical protein